MPDVSPTSPEELTVTMNIPDPEKLQEEVVTEQNNPQEQPQVKPDEISPGSPQEEVKIDTENNANIIEEKKLWIGDSCPIDWCIHKIAWAKENGETIPEVLPEIKVTIEKIECDRCHKILNSKEELPGHNLEFHNGRPCKFCENKEVILKTTNDYFTKCYTSKPQQIPFLEELALILDVDEDTIKLWADKMMRTDGQEDRREHPEFFGLWCKLKTTQKLFLSKRILGRYNPTGAISLLKWHHGMMETEKRILAGSKEQGEEITIRVVEEKPIVTNE